MPDARLSTIIRIAATIHASDPHLRGSAARLAKPSRDEDHQPDARPKGNRSFRLAPGYRGLSASIDPRAADFCQLRANLFSISSISALSHCRYSSASDATISWARSTASGSISNAVRSSPSVMVSNALFFRPVATIDHPKRDLPLQGLRDLRSSNESSRGSAVKSDEKHAIRALKLVIPCLRRPDHPPKNAPSRPYWQPVL